MAALTSDARDRPSGIDEPVPFLDGCPRRSFRPQHRLDHPVGALVEALVEALVQAGCVLQAATVDDDAAGTGADSHDQVAHPGGVAAAVGAAEPVAVGAENSSTSCDLGSGQDFGTHTLVVVTAGLSSWVVGRGAS